jgi:hypothetical protein
VTQIDDTVPFVPNSAPAPTKPSSSTAARARIDAAFAALDTIPRFTASQTETRLAFPERGAPAGLVTETRTMEYVAWDRLSNTSRALDPVGKTREPLSHHTKMGRKVA